jgi:hypothetical protein
VAEYLTYLADVRAGAVGDLRWRILRDTLPGYANTRRVKIADEQVTVAEQLPLL